MEKRHRKREQEHMSRRKKEDMKTGGFCSSSKEANEDFKVAHTSKHALKRRRRRNTMTNKKKSNLVELVAGL